MTNLESILTTDEEELLSSLNLNNEQKSAVREIWEKTLKEGLSVFNGTWNFLLSKITLVTYPIMIAGVISLMLFQNSTVSHWVSISVFVAYFLEAAVNVLIFIFVLVVDFGLKKMKKIKGIEQFTVNIDLKTISGPQSPLDFFTDQYLETTLCVEIMQIWQKGRPHKYYHWIMAIVLISLLGINGLTSTAYLALGCNLFTLFLFGYMRHRTQYVLDHISDYFDPEPETTESQQSI